MRIDRGRPGGTVRSRTTLAAVLAVGVALLLAMAALVLSMRAALVEGVEGEGERWAADVARGYGRGEDGALAVTERDEQFVQVLDSSGRVLAASENLAGAGPVVPPGSTGTSTVTDPLPVRGRFLVVARASEEAGPGRVVVVGQSLEDVTDASRTLVALLALGAPVLLLVVGLTTRRMVGRALAPVEAIRSEVEAISAGSLHRRVPEPPARDEVGRLAATMNRMLERLEAGVDRQRRFVADASHELRSPLASLRQHAEVARAHPDRVDQTELVATVLAESARMQRLVDDLLLLARVDAAVVTRQAREVDLDDLALAAAGRLRGTTALDVDTRAVTAGRVLADEAALRRVVDNLAENAARHARHRVSLGVTSTGTEVALTVDDDGAGIPTPDRTRVLQRFVRLEEDRGRASGGTGLGLAIAAEVVSAHGGSLAVEDGPLGGARLVVRLPRYDEPLPSR